MASFLSIQAEIWFTRQAIARLIDLPWSKHPTRERAKILRGSTIAVTDIDDTLTRIADRHGTRFNQIRKSLLVARAALVTAAEASDWRALMSKTSQPSYRLDLEHCYEALRTAETSLPNFDFDGDLFVVGSRSCRVTDHERKIIEAFQDRYSIPVGEFYRAVWEKLFNVNAKAKINTAICALSNKLAKAGIPTWQITLTRGGDQHVTRQ